MWYFILPETERRADAGIATTVCASENGRNHFHLTRFCSRFCRGGGSDPHVVVMTKSLAQNWSGKSRALFGSLSLILSSLSVFSRPPLPSLIRMGLIWPYCSFPAWIVSVLFSPKAVGSLKVTDPLFTSAEGGGVTAGCLFVAAVCLSVWGLLNVMNRLLLHFHEILIMAQGTGDFSVSTGTFDLSKIKAKLSECFSIF